MNQAIRDHHDKNGNQPHVFFQSVHHKTTEEKFQRKKLNDVKDFPDKVVRHKLITQWKIKRIGRLKLGSVRGDKYQRANTQENQRVNFKISKELLAFHSIVSQSFFKQNFDDKKREGQIKKR